MPETLTTFPMGEHELSLATRPDCFEPNTTTQKIAAQVELTEGVTILDLGCGVGPLAIWAALSGAGHVYAIDIMPEACECARENAARAGVDDKVTVLCGDLFEPVKDQQFDVIINDVSGIAEEAARVSPWYPTSIPTGGNDGTEVAIRVLQSVKSYLTPQGVLYFATSSLSDVGKILTQAKDVFGTGIEKLASYRFPFCPELMKAINVLKQMKDAGLITFEARRSRYLWTLDIFRMKPNDAEAAGQDGEQATVVPTALESWLQSRTTPAPE